MTQHRTGAPFRRQRAVSTGLLCGPGGALAHVASGGAPPSTTVLLLVTAAALAGSLLLASTLLGSRRIGWPGLLVLAGGAQLVFHGLFAAAPAHAMHGPATEPAGSLDPVMLLGHAGVAVAVAALAHGVESAWWALGVVRALAEGLVAVRRLLAVPPLRALPIAPGVPHAPVVDVARPAPSYVALEVVGPRGPPAGLRALAPRGSALVAGPHLPA